MKKLAVLLVLVALALVSRVEKVPQGPQAEYVANVATTRASCSNPRMLRFGIPAGVDVIMNVKEIRQINEYRLDLYFVAPTEILLRPKSSSVEISNLDSGERKFAKFVTVKLEAYTWRSIEFNLGPMGERGYEIALPILEFNREVWESAVIRVAPSSSFFRWKPIFCKSI